MNRTQASNVFKYESMSNKTTFHMLFYFNVIQNWLEGGHTTVLRIFSYLWNNHVYKILDKQGRKRPSLDTPKRMIEKREREGEREKER